jgi:membrane-associated phospholipid phosphatase
MTRGLGVVEFVQSVLPDWAAVVLGLLTQLGDLWFLGVVLGVLFWRLDNERSTVAFVAALFAVGVLATQALKYAFGLPRPGGPPDPATMSGFVRPLYEATALASGPGFPSGHATYTTVVYGGLAATLPVADRRTRYAVAGGLVAVVALTRVFLAHHYLVDVVGGVVLGSSIVAGGMLVRRRLATGFPQE